MGEFVLTYTSFRLVAFELPASNQIQKLFQKLPDIGSPVEKFRRLFCHCIPLDLRSTRERRLHLDDQTELLVSEVEHFQNSWFMYPLLIWLPICFSVYVLPSESSLADGSSKSSELYETPNIDFHNESNQSNLMEVNTALGYVLLPTLREDLREKIQREKREREMERKRDRSIFRKRNPSHFW